MNLDNTYFPLKIGNFKEKIVLVLSSLLAIPLFVFLFGNSLSGYKFFAIPLGILAVALLFNFEIIFGIFFAAMFINAYMLNGTLSEFFSFFVVISVLINYQFKPEELKNNINKYFFLMILSFIPSFFNYTQGLSFLLLTRLIAFLLVIIAASIGFNKEEKINRITTFFVILALMNGLHLIFQAVTTGLRVYGFAGIMYVDYAGIALVITLVKILYSKNKIVFLSVFLIILLALIFTQTRNAWISTAVTLFLVLVQFIFSKRNLISSGKKKLIIVSIFLLVVLVIFQAGRLNPAAFSRVSEGTSTKSETPQLNTFITRAFIWQTAYNAFKAHPINGIGLYNFSFVSKSYSTLDPVIYKMFVEGLSPHESFIEILCETGIIGMLGFLVFLFYSLRFSWKNTKLARTHEEVLVTNIIFWGNMYIFFSMLMTDSWLQGHGLMLWGAFIGLSIACRKLVLSKQLETA